MNKKTSNSVSDMISGLGKEADVGETVKRTELPMDGTMEGAFRDPG